MKTLRIVSLLFASALAVSAQSAVYIQNFNQQAIATMGQIGFIFPPTFQPQVQVLILETHAAPVGYRVTLRYTDQNGVQQAIVQIVAGSAPSPAGNSATFCFFYVNGSYPTAAVEPLMISGPPL